MKSIIISSILSLVISGHNPVSFSYPANIITTPYGTCTYYYSLGSLNQDGFSGLFNGIIFNSDLSMTFIHYEFAGQATGQFDLPVFTNILNNTALTSNYRLFVQGGYLISTPNISGGTEANALRFQVVDSRSMDILIIHPGWNQPAITVSNLYNQNITLTQTENATINEILNYVSYDSGQIQNIKTDTTMIRNLIINLSGYTENSGDNIATDFDTLINAVASLNTNVNKLNNINWITMTVNITYSDTLDGTYTTTLPNNNLRTVYARVEAPTNYDVNYMGDFINKISFGLRSSYSSTPYYYVLLDEIYNYNYQPFNNVLLYYDDYSLGNTVYLNKNVFGNSSNSRYVYFKFTTSGGYFRTNEQTYYGYIDSNNVRYWELLDYFKKNTYHDDYINKLSDVISAINNMSMNVNNLTVNATGITYNVNNTQVNNSVNTYNTDIQNVYNVENDFSTSFNTYNQQFTPDFTETMNTIQSVPSVMNDIVVDLYGLPFIKYPLLLTLAGIVLIALLGV